jgi:hypothetical protein
MAGSEIRLSASTPSLSCRSFGNCRNARSAFPRHCRPIQEFVTGLFVSLLSQCA